MVYQSTIPFGAPSQFRLHVAVDPNGIAHVAVLNAMNQPIGNLRGMKVPFSELKDIAHSETRHVVATGDKAKCTFHMGNDNAHEMLAVDYEDPDNWTDTKSTVTIEDFDELMASLQGTPTPA